MTFTTISRRKLLAAAAAFSAAAAISPVLASTPIACAWARAEALRVEMVPHEGAIASAFRSGGVPGWMRLKGDAYTLGESRYGLLVEILNAAPTSRADLDLQRLAARDAEMQDGPRDWAGARLALAERALPRAA